MILSYGASADLISLILHSELLSANYHIRATQIPCNSPYKAPDDCLQYFYSTSAPIKSFGFPRQLNNQRYTICVKPSSGGTFISVRLSLSSKILVRNVICVFQLKNFPLCSGINATIRMRKASFIGIGSM